MTEAYSLGDMERTTGAARRALQFWTGEGVIKASKGTTQAGRGVHRRYSRDEAIIACVIRPFAERRLAIGELKSIAKALRYLLSSKDIPEDKAYSSGHQAIENGIAGRWRVYLTVTKRGNSAWETSLTVVPPDHEKGTDAFLVGDAMIRRLGEPESFSCMILLNTYTKGLAS